jgi:hypothetical protein
MNLTELREKALAHSKSQKLRLSICLDQDMIEHVAEAKREVTRRETAVNDAAVKPKDGDRRLGTPAPATSKKLEAELKTAKQALADLESQASQETIVLVWRRATPSEYQALEDEYTAGEKVDIDGLMQKVAEQYFEGVYSTQNEKIEMGWDELSESTLSAGDVTMISSELLTFNRGSVVLPFSQKR